MTDVFTGGEMPSKSELMINTVLKYGALSGIIGIILSLIGVLTDTLLDYSWMYSLIGFIVLVIFIFMAVKEYRSKRGGMISFGRAFVTGLATAIVSGVISSFFSFIYFGIITPDYFKNYIYQQEVAMEQRGMSEEEIEMAMSWIEVMTRPGAQLAMGLLSALLLGGIISLIVAAILKRQPD